MVVQPLASWEWVAFFPLEACCSHSSIFPDTGVHVWRWTLNQTPFHRCNTPLFLDRPWDPLSLLNQLVLLKQQVKHQGLFHQVYLWVQHLILNKSKEILIKEMRLDIKYIIHKFIVRRLNSKTQQQK